MQESFVGITMEHRIDLTGAQGLRIVFNPVSDENCLLHLQAANQGVALYLNREQARSILASMDLYVGKEGTQIQRALERGLRVMPGGKNRKAPSA